MVSLFHFKEEIVSKLTFDPALVAVESIPGEPAIHTERLTPDWIRNRFSTPPHWEPEIRVELPVVPRREDWVPASVLIPIVARTDGPTLLLTKRADHLYHHGGQISFPGGRADEEDASRVATALRELEEEVGLHRRHVEVVGTLPDYHTGTGFCVTPVVSIVQPPFELQTDPFEVAEAFEVPLSFLMNGTHHQIRTADFPNGLGRRTYYSMQYEQYFIWGATAGILRNLFHFLRA
jgi:8-oxo-dGTP pyrophosphatase MutT (NUDIX family)